MTASSDRIEMRSGVGLNKPTHRQGAVALSGPDGEFERRVRAVLAGLRRGEVATYGEVAEEAGYPRAARAVGNVVARSEDLPWWRVVAANGRLVPGHEVEHARRLRAEDVVVGPGSRPSSLRASGPAGQHEELALPPGHRRR